MINLLGSWQNDVVCSSDDAKPFYQTPDRERNLVDPKALLLSTLIFYIEVGSAPIHGLKATQPQLKLFVCNTRYVYTFPCPESIS